VSALASLALDTSTALVCLMLSQFRFAWWHSWMPGCTVQSAVYNAGTVKTCCEDKQCSCLCCSVCYVLQVVIQELPGQGRGLVANAAVRKGELLVAVPQQLVITPQTAAAGAHAR
jgi:hypothetical protein